MALDDKLASSAVQHLEIATAALQEAPAWDATSTRLQRQLLDQGFHRTLKLQLFGLPSPGQWDALGKRAGASPSCSLVLLQQLPSGLFADPYQLEELQRKSIGTQFKLLGPLDLEL